MGDTTAYASVSGEWTLWYDVHPPLSDSYAAASTGCLLARAVTVAILKVWRHNQEPDYINWHAFTSRTVLTNFMLFWSRPNNKKNKMRSDMGSVADPKMLPTYSIIQELVITAEIY